MAGSAVVRSWLLSSEVDQSSVLDPGLRGEVDLTIESVIPEESDTDWASPGLTESPLLHDVSRIIKHMADKGVRMIGFPRFTFKVYSWEGRDV
jgi:hypothetical protein